MTPNTPQRILFIDRDGTIVEEPHDEQVDALEKIRFKPGVFHWLAFLREKTDFRFVMVSNQDGLGTSSFPEDTFWPAHNFILEALSSTRFSWTTTFQKTMHPRANRRQGWWRNT